VKRMPRASRSAELEDDARDVVQHTRDAGAHRGIRSFARVGRLVVRVGGVGDLAAARRGARPDRGRDVAGGLGHLGADHEELPVEVARRHEGEGLTFNAVSPGTVKTTLGSKAGGAFKTIEALTNPFVGPPRRDRAALCG